MRMAGGAVVSLTYYVLLVVGCWCWFDCVRGLRIVWSFSVHRMSHSSIFSISKFEIVKERRGFSQAGR